VASVQSELRYCCGRKRGAPDDRRNRDSPEDNSGPRLLPGGQDGSGRAELFSDIDLIRVFFDQPHRRSRDIEPQPFFVRV